MFPTRTQLVVVDAFIPSCYGDGKGGFKPLAGLTGGKMVPEAAKALTALHQAVVAAGSVHQITDCWRSAETQKIARAKYDLWVSSGKPKPGTAGFDSKTMKADYVAAPGYSNHETGRAIDATTSRLSFPGLPADKQLDKYWEIAKPLGWSPIIKEAKEGTTENWHFDFWGEWQRVKDVYGYSVASMCGHLDVGIGVYGDDLDKLLQAQLHRAGIDVGPIDGAVGPNTKKGCAHVGIDADHVDWQKLFALPSSSTVIWKA